MMLHFRVKCPGCGKLVCETEFGIDQESRKEYLISGLCQVCQDQVFQVQDQDLTTILI